MFGHIRERNIMHQDRRSTPLPSRQASVPSEVSIPPRPKHHIAKEPPRRRPIIQLQRIGHVPPSSSPALLLLLLIVLLVLLLLIMLGMVVVGEVVVPPRRRIQTHRQMARIERQRLAGEREAYICREGQGGRVPC